MAAKGLCSVHYARMHRHGSPDVLKRTPGLTDAQRFWQYVQKGPDCWLWTGAVSHTYGNFFLPVGPSRYRQIAAHRYAYELLIGPIPDGLTIDHICHTADCRVPVNDCPHRRCVNPAHLRPVTLAKNIQRTGNGAKTHCKRGHEFTPSNTYVMRNGGRMCRACRHVRDARV
jgi:hypothetical protein